MAVNISDGWSVTKLPLAYTAELVVWVSLIPDNARPDIWKQPRPDPRLSGVPVGGKQALAEIDRGIPGRPREWFVVRVCRS
jgi:hypothetical protein